MADQAILTAIKKKSFIHTGTVTGILLSTCPIPESRMYCRKTSIIDTVIKDQFFFSCITGEQGKETENQSSQGQHKRTSIWKRVLQQLISCILPEWQVIPGDYSSEKRITLKMRHADYGARCD